MRRGHSDGEPLQSPVVDEAGRRKGVPVVDVLKTGSAGVGASTDVSQVHSPGPSGTTYDHFFPVHVPYPHTGLQDPTTDTYPGSRTPSSVTRETTGPPVSVLTKPPTGAPSGIQSTDESES